MPARIELVAARVIERHRQAEADARLDFPGAFDHLLRADEVEAATRLFLGGGTVSQSDIQVFITGEDGFPALPGQPVSVVISIPAARVMPQFGAMIGFAFGENQLVARTTMRKE